MAVSLVAAREVKTPRLVTLSGTLIGSEEAQVAAGAAGKVIATYVERGSVVKKGAVLARLDSRAAERAGRAGGRRRRGVEAAGAAGEARLRAHRADVREGRDLEGRLRQGAHAVRDQQVDGVVGRGAQDADRRGAARHRDPRAVLRHGRRARGHRGRVRAARLARRRRWSTPTRCASRSPCPRPTSPLRQAGDAGRLPHRRRRAAARVYHGKIRYVGPSVRRRAATRSSRRCSTTTSHELRPGMFVTARLALGEQTLPAVPANGGARRRDAAPRLRRDGRPARGSAGAGGRAASAARCRSSAASRPASRSSPS